MTGPLKIPAVLIARSGKADALRDLLDIMLTGSRAAPGNLRYDLWVDQADPGRFVLDELYADANGLAAHRGSAQFVTYLASFNNLVEQSAFTLDPLTIG